MTDAGQGRIDVTPEARLDGFAKCTNGACAAAEELEPIELVTTTRRQFGLAPLQNLVIAESVFTHPANDAVINCPACGKPRALLDGLPREVPKHPGSYPSGAGVGS